MFNEIGVTSAAICHIIFTRDALASRFTSDQKSLFGVSHTLYYFLHTSVRHEPKYSLNTFTDHSVHHHRPWTVFV